MAWEVRSHSDRWLKQYRVLCPLIEANRLCCCIVVMRTIAAPAGRAPRLASTERKKIRAGTVLWHKEHARPKACIRHVITACLRHSEITFERAR